MWLSKRPLFGGIALGFLACCGLGRLASRQVMFEHFLRFNVPTEPQNLFYPTASELVTYLRHAMIPGKKLALVGGASYLRGWGQNPSELWSQRLQEALAPDYQVINFAVDAAEVTSFAAVPFQILEPEHPDMIYLSNGSPVVGCPPDGNEIYRYIFWDAYYKGLFPAVVAGAPAVHDQRAAELRTAAGVELHLGKWIDSLTYACDLWNYVGYKWLFTAWSDDEAGAPLRPRREFVEQDNPGFRIWQRNNEQNPAIVAAGSAGNLNLVRSGYERLPDGHWRIAPNVWSGRRESWRNMLPAEMRARTFIIFLRPNPYYMRTLTPEDWAHFEHDLRVGKRAYEAEGYHVVQFGPGDLRREDFLDSGHLLPSGGDKVAAATAARVREFERAPAEIPAPWPTHPGPAVGAVFRLRASDEAFDRSLPLATTGRTGAGDVLLARWSSRGALSFGYDHWNDRLLVSPELNVAPDSEHEVSFRLPALVADRRLTVWVDGKVFWQTVVPVYPHLPTEVYWAQNPIGASTAEPSLAEGQFMRWVAP